jgi:hypothetical protein
MRALITLLELVQQLAMLVYRRLHVAWLEHDIVRLHAEQRECLAAVSHLADLAEDLEYLITERTEALADAKAALSGETSSEAA